jgi:hypothetical protein
VHQTSPAVTYPSPSPPSIAAVTTNFPRKGPIAPILSIPAQNRGRKCLTTTSHYLIDPPIWSDLWSWSCYSADLSYSLTLTHPWHMAVCFQNQDWSDAVSTLTPSLGRSSYDAPPSTPQEGPYSGPFHPSSRDLPDPRFSRLTSASNRFASFPFLTRPYGHDSKLSSSTPLPSRLFPRSHSESSAFSILSSV